MITIGYQGIKGSNSEEAAKQLAIKQGFEKYKLLPLVSSFNVLQNVLLKNIDYGVIAMRNKTGGNVIESVKSLAFMDVQKIDSVTLPIHHYLFVRDKTIKKHQLRSIASHPQAFTQCTKTLQKNYSHSALLRDEDTATAALKLQLGLFDDYTGVLCRKNAGIDNHLFLLDEHLEDETDNTTEFHMYGSI